MAKPKKHELFTSAYLDGLVTGLAIDDETLRVRIEADGRTAAFSIDLASGEVGSLLRATALKAEAGMLRWPEATFGTTKATAGSADIRLSRPKVVLRRAGKNPRLGFGHDGRLFSSATEVLNRWDASSGQATKFKAFDKVVAVATSDTRVIAANKEGVISFFDPSSTKRLVMLRLTFDGWLSFDDEGAFDSSPGFRRGVELSYTDAKSTAFVPEVGFGVLAFNLPPLIEVTPTRGRRVQGLLRSRLGRG